VCLRLYWCRFRFDHKWPVYLVHPDLMALTGDPLNFAATHGLKNWSPDIKREIWVNAYHSKYIQDRSLLHELGHVALDGIKQRRKTEELFVATLEGPLFSLLTRHCRLRMPRRPRGTADLMRRSRNV